MDSMRIKRLEEKEELLRDTFEDCLLSLERNSEASMEKIRLMKALCEAWRGARELIEAERRLAGKDSAVKL